MRLLLHYAGRVVVVDEFEEAKHPRGPKGSGRKGGEFVKKGSGGGAASPARGGRSAPARGETEAAAPAPGVSLTRTNQRAYTGSPKPNATRLDKHVIGALGEDIARAYIASLGGGRENARPLNEKQANYPLDMVGDHELYEIKTGQVSNGLSAQQWRATIGQPSKTEAKWLKTASEADKRALNLRKQGEIMARKARAKQDYEAEVGHPVKAKTVTLIIDPDTQTADIYLFDDYHLRIGWNGERAKAGYQGSFKYRTPAKGRAAGDMGRVRRLARRLRALDTRRPRPLLWHLGCGQHSRET